jgi:hypothetical protein
MKTEYRAIPQNGGYSLDEGVIPQSKGYSLIEGVPAGSARFADSRSFIDGAALLKYLDAIVRPTVELRAVWETQIARRSAFSVFT